jgi:hypothetical protein
VPVWVSGPPTQALKSFKDPGNTFDLSPKWARTVPYGIFHWIFIEPPPPHLGIGSKVDHGSLINISAWVGFCIPSPQQCVKYQLDGLEVQKPTQEHKSVSNTDNIFDLKPKWSRTLPEGMFHGIFIDPLPHKKN